MSHIRLKVSSRLVGYSHTVNNKRQVLRSHKIPRKKVEKLSHSDALSLLHRGFGLRGTDTLIAVVDRVPSHTATMDYLTPGLRTRLECQAKSSRCCPVRLAVADGNSLIGHREGEADS